MNRRWIAVSLFALLLVCALDVFARVGGGHSSSGGGHSSGHSSSSHSSYGGSHSGGYGSGGGSANLGCSLVFFIMFVLILIVVANAANRRAAPGVVYRATPSTSRLDLLRNFDPNFSRIVFDDFCYSLYARVHHARGAGDLARYAPYLSEAARKVLPQDVDEVRGIVIGAIHLGDLDGLNTPTVRIAVTYEGNMTEVVKGTETSWYVEDRWMFERRRDVLSPPPAKAKAEHCPRCGAALQTRTDGACEYCGVKVDSGAFQWYVRSIQPLKKEIRGPLLTSNVEEQGTDLPTISQPDFARRKSELEAAHPGFRWDELIARVRQISVELQAAWTARDWERVRPLESDSLFQTHRYWIDAYIRQHLCNIVDGFEIGQIEPVKIDADAFYDAITLRIFARGRDYTVDEQGKVIGGSNTLVRSWSEYWTFIRTRATQANPNATVSCPNCGASVAVGSTGICSFCKGKLTSGDFSWVLSRIEQDEAYSG